MSIKYYKQITEEEKNEIGEEEANKYINDIQRNSGNDWINTVYKITRESGMPCGEVENISVTCSKKMIIVNVTVNYYNESKISLIKLIFKDGTCMFIYKIDNYEEMFGKLDKDVFKKYFYNNNNFPTGVENFIKNIEDFRLYK